MVASSALAQTVNFTTCLEEVRSGQWGTIGGTDNNGHPVSNISEATAITYDLCVRACGSGSESFNWNIFSQQFTWFPAYLALVSQLPFGARTRLDNFVSMLLAVGSPTLAAYSLALTVINGHWIAQRFSHLSYPNVKNAVKILSSLQQSPLCVDTEDLASLVVLHANDEFWEELAVWLNYVHTWSIAAVASILWVVIAYFFTVVDNFTGNVVTYSTLNSNGQTVGSVFLWLLPVVVAWLQISPKCDSERVHQAMERANKFAYVATPEGEPTLASNVSSKRAIYLRKGAGDSLRRDEHITAPIFNYSRFLSWTFAVEDVYSAFREASQKSESYQPVDSATTWQSGDRTSRIRPANRSGSLPQVVAYIEPAFKPWAFLLEGDGQARRRVQWGPGVVPRFLMASLVALGLTWGTVGAAIVGSWFVPTKGIGCRAGSYIIYGTVATLVWMMLVASSFLAHYSAFTATVNGRYHHTKSTHLAGIMSIILRRTGKFLAALNAIWIVLACLFQFSSFFDRCLCNSSVFSLGKNAFNAIDLLPSDIVGLNAPWIGGVALASGTSILFMGFVNILINPVLPD
ncbi:hypothetical protein GGX14DRAFT_532680 [Mycena pura]|uniref:Uncharacterized protein n=1 Tax=Mycena pura TaxID=153505 RepID=A0AAD6VQA3_9AGAR|nr:hypothetical protein GGX14DRAFT_532680 [Mycena pura]